MTQPKHIRARTLHLARLVGLAGLAAVLSACGSMQNRNEQVVSYEHRPEYGFVRIERLEPGAPDNSHPFTISAGVLKQTLANVRVKGAVSRDATPLFNADEVSEIAPPLAAALAKAGPKEDVTFAVAGHHGLLGKYSRQSVITGRVFVRDNRLNVVFGQVHEPIEEISGANALHTFVPGSRARPLETGWRVAASNGRSTDNRPDWITFDASALPAAAPLSAPADSRYLEIEQKLGVLERLKANGLITEQEYRERRRTVLEGL